MFTTLTTACGQKKNEQENFIRFTYAMDIYRAHVADSLKYLIPILDSVLESDQKYRYGSAYNSNGKFEPEKQTERFRLHNKEVKYIDSLNIIKISAILDKYGWLGYRTIGIQENNAIFLVIQHADISTQEKYLPLLKKAVMDKKENPQHLAMLEDRVSIRKNKYQIYGTQVIYDFQKKQYYLMPIIEPENILERRKSIGLDSVTFQSYLNLFHVVWNMDAYEKQLPEIKQLMSHLK